MGLLDHLAFLIRTNVEDLLDRSTDPGKAADRLISEMRASVDEANQQIAEMIALEVDLRSELSDAEATATDWHEKARRAVAAGKDDIAGEALRRWRDSKDNAQIYARQAEAQQDAIRQMKQRKARLESKLGAISAQRDELVARHSRTQSENIGQEAISEEDLFSASRELESLERRIREKEARIDAIDDARTTSVDAQLDVLEFSMSVDAELLRLKQTAGESEPARSSDPVDNA